MKDLTTMEACYQKTGMDIKLREIFKQLPEKQAKQQLANFDRGVITEAINMNEDGTSWVPDMSDANEWKYFLWVWIKKDTAHSSGLGFSGSVYGYARASTIVGSRFAFKTRERMEFAFKHFEEVFKDDILIV